MSRPSHNFLHLLVLVSGLAALSWQVLWQVKSTLALGVSAQGTALTLAVTMGGMCLGALIMGHVLKAKTASKPVKIYAILECIIGLAGLCLAYFFTEIERLDTWAYTGMPGNSSLIHIAGITLALGIPTLCMGATLPVLGLAARQFETSIAMVYALNTLGAAVGALLAAFVLIPSLGINSTIKTVAILNIVVGIAAWILAGKGEIKTEATSDSSASAPVPHVIWFTVFATGYATFALEVAWFRSLTAAFRSTTDAFAIMLACVLIALGVGARIVPYLQKRNASLGTLVGWAGILILLATPLIERFDMVTTTVSMDSPFTLFKWFMMTFYVIAPPVLLLGIALPWILQDRNSPRSWGTLYAFNSFSAVLGALTAAWILLPTIGFAKTAWLAGLLVAIAGMALTKAQKRRVVLKLFTILALIAAVTFESGVGTTRVQGWFLSDKIKEARVLEAYEGPDSTVSAVEYDDGHRAVIIDGFAAAQQLTEQGKIGAEHYMAWMGHLPMLLHSNPKHALVICFGTGQTANAVRKENPETLDIVDINQSVFKLAHNFPMNEDVLNDPRVTPIVMDGRAYMRRTNKMYDVITLEPMPPTFAGVNALYSKEFYEFAKQKLNPGGMIAQWVPFHILGVHSSVSIAKTFQSVFPNSILWIDPPSGTGILIGSNGDYPIGDVWPGFDRTNIERSMGESDVKKAISLRQEKLKVYGDYGAEITDDNQLLAYGRAVSEWRRYGKLEQENLDLLQSVEQLAADHPIDFIE
jgi:spermidine synthase